MPPKNQRFTEIFEQHRGLLRAALRSLPRTPGPVDLDDIEQEVALRLWRALEDGREIREMSAYLRALVRSAVFDALRRAKVRHEADHQALEGESEEPKRSAAELPSPIAGPETTTASAELSRALRDSLHQLHPPRRQAVKLYIHGFANREISRLLGWSEGKTRNLTSRGLADLRLELQKRGWSHERE